MPTTGVRVINSLILNGGPVSGTLGLQRVGPIVTLTAASLQLDGSGSSQLCSLPSGFRPGTRIASEWCARDQPQYFDVYSSGSVWCGRNGPGKSHNGLIAYTTTDAWPMTLPGSAV